MSIVRRGCIRTFEGFDGNWSVFVAHGERSTVNDGEPASQQGLLLLNLIQLHFLSISHVTGRWTAFLNVVYLLLKFYKYST